MSGRQAWRGADQQTSRLSSPLLSSPIAPALVIHAVIDQATDVEVPGVLHPAPALGRPWLHLRKAIGGMVMAAGGWQLGAPCSAVLPGGDPSAGMWR